MFDFTDKVVMITGAAGALGQHVAMAFKAAHARLVLVDRASDRLPELFPDVGADHYLAGGVDLLHPEQIQGMVLETMDRFGRIDVLVNVAGGFRMGTPVHETPRDTMVTMLNLNANTVYNMAQAVVPHMLEQQTGRVVNIGANGALKGGAMTGAYAASKAVVHRFTESMAAELKGTGITVNAVLPGIIDTPANRDAMPNADFSKWVDPADLANAILFLASEAARAITGVLLPVTGAD